MTRAMIFSDEVNSQSDKRNLEKMADAGEIDLSDLANAPVLSASECCLADMLGQEGTIELICGKCGKPCEGAEE